MLDGVTLRIRGTPPMSARPPRIARCHRRRRHGATRPALARSRTLDDLYRRPDAPDTRDGRQTSGTGGKS